MINGLKSILVVVDPTVEAAWDAPSHVAILTEIALTGPDLVIKDSPWQEQIMRRLFSHADWRLMQACPVPVLLTRQAAWASPRRVTAGVDPGHPGDPARVLDHAILTLAERLFDRVPSDLLVVRGPQP